MAQFDVHRIGDGGLVVDLQSDIIGYDVSRLVAPVLTMDGARPLPILTPVVHLPDGPYKVHVMEMLTVPQHVLGPALYDLAHARDDLFRAIDFLTHGF